MNRKYSQWASATIFFVVMVGSITWARPAHAPAAGCSNATLSGNAGFRVSGLNTSGPVAAVGQLTADGKGHFTGMETVSSNGTVLTDIPVSGTYAIQANCTGKGTIGPKHGTTSHFSFVVLSGGNELPLVLTDTGTAELGSTLTQGTSSCSKVQGTYGFQGGGIIVGVGPVVFVGQAKLQNGVISGTESGSINGTIFTKATIDGVYKIDSRCFGAAKISVNHATPSDFNLVVVNGQKTVEFIGTDSGTVISGAFQQ